MKNPKISIITATYNSAKTIQDTIVSINAQTYRNFEHVIIDGLSNDDTIEKIQRLANHPLTIVREKDNGIYDALNKGIKHATGDVIGFLHSDDEYHSAESLDHIAKEFEEPACDATYGDLIYISKDTKKIVRTWISGEYTKQKLKFGWMPPHPTFYMKRTLYENFGSFDTQFKIAADYDAMLRYLWKNDVHLHYTPNTIVTMKTGGASNRSIKNIIQKTREDIQALKKHNIPFLMAITCKNLSKLTQLFK